MEQSERQPEREGMPRWAKVTALVAAALVALLVVMVVVGGGDHGPGRHTGGNHRVVLSLERGG